MLTGPRLAAVAVTVSLGLSVAAPAAAGTAAGTAGTAAGEPSGSGRQLMADLRRAWQVTTGHGVTVAVLSDGVDPHVTGLAGKVTTGPDYVKLRDPRFLDGTIIASAIAGESTIGGGSRGIAPDARILSVRIVPDDGEPGSQNFDDNVFSPDLEAQGIRYAVAHGASVIYIDLVPNLIDSPDLDAAVRYALGRGVVITTLAAADNHGGNDVTYPAGIPGIIAASMVALPAPFQSAPSLAGASALNVAVLVTVPGNTISAVGPGGDSFTAYSYDAAAGWLAGTAALIKSAHPRLAPALVARALALSARDHPKGGYDIRTGFGIINPDGALAEAARLARPATIRPAGLGPDARFGAAPPEIRAVDRSPARVAAFAAVAATGVIMLAVALILALRRPRAERERIRLQQLVTAACYSSLRSASRSRMLAWTLTRPEIHIRAMLAGVADSEMTSSLLAVILMSAGGSSGLASVTGVAP